MSSKTKITREEVQQQVGCDQVTLCRGVYTVRTGYFYTHGRSTDNLINAVRSAFPDAVILDSGDVWKAFRGGAKLAAQSHWWVKFTL